MENARPARQARWTWRWRRNEPVRDAWGRRQAGRAWEARLDEPACGASRAPSPRMKTVFTQERRAEGEEAVLNKRTEGCRQPRERTKPVRTQTVCKRRAARWW